MTQRRPRGTKAATGTTRPGRDRKRPPPRVPGTPPMPGTLTALERGHWLAFERLLSARGQLGLDSEPMLRELAHTAAEVQELRADVSANGRTTRVLRSGGDPADPACYWERPRPQVAALADASRRYLALLKQCGLTPASAASVALDPDGDDGDDPAARYGIC